MTIPVGGGGGGLIMPYGAALKTASVSMKVAAGGTGSANSAGFWTAVDLSHTAAGWESVKIAAAADQNEQTIVDVSGAGVLTQVLAPELSGAGIMTIRVTVDGIVKTFISETLATGQRFFAGHFYGYLAELTAGNGQGIGSANDSGYDTATNNLLMPTAQQTLSEGTIGMSFKSTLKVTIQANVNITGTANILNGCAIYSLALPEGL